MTEVDALIRARSLLEEPATPRGPGAGVALSLSLIMAVLAIAAAGAVILSPPTVRVASR